MIYRSHLNYIGSNKTAIDVYKPYIKENYLSLRHKYNITRNPIQLYILSLHSFSNLIKVREVTSLTYSLGRDKKSHKSEIFISNKE